VILTACAANTPPQVARHPDKIAEIFGTPLNRTMRGKLATVIDRIEHGHHVFRAYFLESHWCD
jgi:hypothetical protein